MALTTQNHGAFQKGMWLSPRGVAVFSQGGGGSHYTESLCFPREVKLLLYRIIVFSRTVCGLDHPEALRFPEEDVASTTQIPCLLPRAVRLLTYRHKSLLAAPSFCSIVSLCPQTGEAKRGYYFFC